MPRVPKDFRQTQFLTMILPEYDFGVDIDTTLNFRLPAGYNAELLKIGIAVTEAFACTTTVAKILLGTATDTDAYAQLEIADGAAVTDFQDETDDTNAILNKYIPKDTLLRLSLIQSTDETADAGKGLPMLYFRLTVADQ